MKKKIILILIISIVILLNIINFNSLAINTEEEMKVDIFYEYDKSRNIVIVKAKSNRELVQKRLSGWILGLDKRSYIAEYDKNQIFNTFFTDTNGNKIEKQIVIEDIDDKGPEIDVNYIYNSDTNTVLVKATSNEELIQKTLPGWILGTDKKSYTAEYELNQVFNTFFTDIYGNKTEKEIVIDKVIQTGSPSIDIQYEYDNKRNVVIVKATSDRKLIQKTLPGWVLGTDKMSYTAEYGVNQTFETYFTDIYGNKTLKEIVINKVDDKGPVVNVEYSYDNITNKETVIVTSNEKMKQKTLPGWILSEDKMSYTAIYDRTQTFETYFTDIYGNKTLQHINISQVDDKGPEVQVKYSYNSDKTLCTVYVTSNEEMIQKTLPGWILDEDKKSYTAQYNTNQDFNTFFTDIYGNKTEINILINEFLVYEKGTYGRSGAMINGYYNGSTLDYYRFGQGRNVMFATFCVHGYEDSWDKDGTVLTNIANDFYKKLVDDKDMDLAKKWTIYIFPQVNPDGIKLGYTKNGPGRTTLYSKLGRGMDINRCWQTGNSYTMYTDNRNYNGTEGFQAYEAESLKEFFLSHKSVKGQTILVDLHGWEEQLIGDEQVCKYYKQQYTSCSTRNYGRYGTQYIITWARQNLGAKVSLVELPQAYNQAQVNSMDLSNKYVNATLNMLRGI